MSVAIVTGSGGLIGSSAAVHLAQAGFDVVGIDNDMRRVFFGDEASTAWNVADLERSLGSAYRHETIDIRSAEGIDRLFATVAPEIEVVIHAAAQPSHDWAAGDPQADFAINAVGTLNLLEAAKSHCPDAPFIFTSTNKVYGDRPNSLPLEDHDTRLELPADHRYWAGIEEDMSVDECLHSLFGVSKTAADLLVQEYGRYFDMPTVCFRGGTLTGPAHSATKLHGFLAYVMRCTISGTSYEVIGYGGKQVRDAIHSSDLIAAFDAFRLDPRPAAVYNIGGGRDCNASVLEAIAACERIADRRLDWSYTERNRVGDHRWWIGSNARFEADYPDWSTTYDLDRILTEIFEANEERWSA